MANLISFLCLLFAIVTVQTSAGSDKDEILEAQASGHYGVPLALGWNGAPGIYGGGQGWGAPVTALAPVAVVHKEIPVKSVNYGWGVENFHHGGNNHGWGWNPGHAHSYQYFNAVQNKGWGWKPQVVVETVPVGGWGWGEAQPVIVNQPVINNGWGWQSPKPAHPVVVGLEHSNGWGWPQAKPVIVAPIHNNGWGWPQAKPVHVHPIQSNGWGQAVNNGWGQAVNNGWGWTGSGYGLG